MGFFSNNYPDRMPFLERVGKELRFRKAVKASRRAHGEPQFIVVHSDWPSKCASIMAYAAVLGYVVTNLMDTVVCCNGCVCIELAFDDRTEKRQARPGMWIRYTNETVEVDLVKSPKSVLSVAEIGKILTISAKMCAEFAELDILRNREDGRIYCVDLNPTPYGPPAGLTAMERNESTMVVSEVIRKLV